MTKNRLTIDVPEGYLVESNLQEYCSHCPDLDVYIEAKAYRIENYIEECFLCIGCKNEKICKRIYDKKMKEEPVINMSLGEEQP